MGGMESPVDVTVRGSGHSFTRKDAGHNLDYEILRLMREGRSEC